MTRGVRVWAGLAASGVLAAACFVGASDEGASSEQDVSSVPAGLSAVVAIEGGCTAVKVGPKHLLLAARCVTNKPAFAINKPIKFRKGNVTTEADVVSDERPDAAAPDASADDAGKDAAAPEPLPAGELIEDTIAEVKIHPSYLAKCGTGACADPRRPAAAEVADVALIVLKGENDIPVVPIETDPVGVGSKVLVVSSGCRPGGAARLRAQEAKLAGADALGHEGTPYTGDLAKAVVGSYVVTRGPGSAERNSMGICAERDFGAPLLLGDGAAVVGVNANITAAAFEAGAGPALPQTNLHARVDAVARHQVGAWLAQGGAKTTKACTADAGCKPGEAVVVTDSGSATPRPPDGGKPDAAPIPNDEDDTTSEFTPPEEETPPPAKPAAKPKKKAADSGCSASPTTNGSSLGFALFVWATLLFGLRRKKAQRPVVR
jgi:hypothetical protein